MFVFVRFSMILPSPPQQTYFLNDPFLYITACKKCTYLEFFWSAFSRIRRRTEYLPDTDTLYAVSFICLIYLSFPSHCFCRIRSLGMFSKVLKKVNFRILTQT